jgi:hypothetical protein
MNSLRPSPISPTILGFGIESMTIKGERRYVG